MRTDANNNPAAITTDIAKQGGLLLGTDYAVGTVFPMNPNLFTARILGDPIALTIRVIDAIGFYTKAGAGRWTYIALPKFVWSALTPEEKRDVIGYMYRQEGGVAMRLLFPNYTRL
jgi:hypothetical protein